MAFFTFIKTFVQFFPDIINMIKWINNKVETGVSQSQIKKDMETITTVFEGDKSAEQKAGELNDVFKN